MSYSPSAEVQTPGYAHMGLEGTSDSDEGDIHYASDARENTQNNDGDQVEIAHSTTTPTLMTGLTESEIKIQQAALANEYSQIARVLTKALEQRTALTLKKMIHLEQTDQNKALIKDDRAHLYHMGKLLSYQVTSIRDNSRHEALNIWRDFHRQKMDLRDGLGKLRRDKITRIRTEYKKSGIIRDSEVPIMDWISFNLDTINTLTNTQQLPGLGSDDINADIKLISSWNNAQPESDDEINDSDSNNGTDNLEPKRRKLEENQWQRSSENQVQSNNLSEVVPKMEIQTQAVPGNIQTELMEVKQPAQQASQVPSSLPLQRVQTAAHFSQGSQRQLVEPQQSHTQVQNYTNEPIRPQETPKSPSTGHKYAQPQPQCQSPQSRNFLQPSSNMQSQTLASPMVVQAQIPPQTQPLPAYIYQSTGQQSLQPHSQAPSDILQTPAAAPAAASAQGQPQNTAQGQQYYSVASSASQYPLQQNPYQYYPGYTVIPGVSQYQYAQPTQYTQGQPQNPQYVYYPEQWQQAQYPMQWSGQYAMWPGQQQQQ